MNKCFVVISLIFLLICSCKEKQEGHISYSQETILGKQLDSLISKDNNINILSDTGNFFSVYSFLDSMITKLTSSNKIITSSNKYYVRILIENASNIFTFPPCYFYITNGLLKNLENSAQLATLLSHFIVHNDRRHLITKLEEIYGIDNILSAVSGNSIILKDIKYNLQNNTDKIKYDIKNEKDADYFSIYYMNSAGYDVNELLNLEKIVLEVSNFSIIHPTYLDRENYITSIYESIGSPEGSQGKLEYRNFINNLP